MRQMTEDFLNLVGALDCPLIKLKVVGMRMEKVRKTEIKGNTHTHKTYTTDFSRDKLVERMGM